MIKKIFNGLLITIIGLNFGWSQCYQTETFTDINGNGIYDDGEEFVRKVFKV